jgi:hypothetical protein
MWITCAIARNVGGASPLASTPGTHAWTLESVAEARSVLAHLWAADNALLDHEASLRVPEAELPPSGR